MPLARRSRSVFGLVLCASQHHHYVPNPQLKRVHIATEYACLKGFDAIVLHEKIDEPKLRRSYEWIDKLLRDKR